VKFIETGLPGAWVVEPEHVADERGFFARTWCRREFEARGLDTRLAQCNVSFNRRKGTLRGLHWQVPPHEEIKLVRCTMGAVFDVVVDVRRGSPSFARWFGIELSAENRKAIYIPGGFAHGFQSLTANTEVFYQMSEFYEPTAACGARWNDPRIGIEWPLADPIVSERDQALPELGRAE
jgi:dTDP-4-dehydrorhamnose 3,5-epimerase